MSVKGGSLIEVDIGGESFSVPADNAPERRLGGSTNEYEANSDGSGAFIQTTMGWQITVEIRLEDRDADQEYLQSVADFGDDVDMTFTYPSTIYRGKGNITGEILFDSSGAKASITLQGPGTLDREVNPLGF